jgi:hypothetical protein
MRKISRERVVRRGEGGGEINRMVVAKGPMCRVRTTNQLIMAQPRYTVQYTTFRWFTSSECQAYLFSNCCTVHPHLSEKVCTASRFLSGCIGMDTLVPTCSIRMLRRHILTDIGMHWNGFVRHSGRIGTLFFIRMQGDTLTSCDAIECKRMNVLTHSQAIGMY